MSRLYPTRQGMPLVKFGLPLAIGEERTHDFLPNKDANVICIRSLQGRCKNGTRCDLIHPAEGNLIRAIGILIEEGVLAGSTNRLYVTRDEKAWHRTNGDQICLNFLKHGCYGPPVCRWLHADGKSLAYLLEPLSSPFAPPKPTRQFKSRDSAVLAPEPPIISLDSAKSEKEQLPIVAQSEKSGNSPPPLPATLPVTYDESSASSSDQATSESGDSQSSSDVLACSMSQTINLRLPPQVSSDFYLDVPKAAIPLDICRDFYRSGVCLRSTSCRYRHTRPSRPTAGRDASVTAGTVSITSPAACTPRTTGSGIGMDDHVTQSLGDIERLFTLTPSAAPISRPFDSLTSEPNQNNHSLQPLVRFPQQTASPSHLHSAQPLASTEGHQQLWQLDSTSTYPDDSRAEPRRNNLRIPSGYCFNWLYGKACPFSGPCPYKHELPLGWNREAHSRYSSVPTPSTSSAERPTTKTSSFPVERQESTPTPSGPQHLLPSRPHHAPVYLSRPNIEPQVLRQTAFDLPSSSIVYTKPPRFRTLGEPHKDAASLSSAVVFSSPFPPDRRQNGTNHSALPSVTAHQSSGPMHRVPSSISQPPAQFGPSSDINGHHEHDQTQPVIASIRPALPLKNPHPAPTSIIQGPSRPKREDLTLPIFDPSSATFGPGFCIKSVVTPNDTRMVTIANVPRNTKREALEKFISPYANVVEVRIPDTKDGDDTRPMRMTVVLASHQDAVRIVESLDDAKVFGSHLELRLLLPPAAREQASGGDLCVTWPLPTKRCYGGYNTEEEAKQAVERYNGVDVRGYWVTASIYEGLPVVGLYNVRFDGMPPDTTVKQMDQFKADSVMMDRSPLALERFGIPAVDKIMRGCGKLIYFEPAPMPFKDGVARAWCRFESTDIARLACELTGVSQRSLKGQCLEVKRMCSLRYHISSAVYVVIQDDIEEFKASVSKRYPGSSIRVTERESRDSWSDSMTVRILAETPKEVSAIKARLVDMVRGETIMNGNRPLWDRSFGMTSGQPWLDSVRRANRSVIIIAEAARCYIRVVGAPEKRKKVVAEITDYYAILRERPVYSIPLSSGLIGLFVHSELVAEGKYSPEDMWLDMPKRLLCVRADEAVYEQIQQKVHLATEQHGSPRECAAQDKCLVCLAPPTTPVELPCGHKYCKACLVGYLNSATETRIFPIECFGADAACKEPVPLIIARDIMPPADWIALLRAAFNAHVSARPDEFRYCPTPDCPQVYRPGPRGSVYSCPACLVRICPHCHVEYHEGVTCEDYEFGHDHEAMFEKWMQENNVKSCPKCKVPIERRDGCNHMQCSRCLTHMCWVCMATFETSGSVYHHMGAEHGGAF